MTRRKDSPLRRLVDTLACDLRERRIEIEKAAFRMIKAGAPFDVALRICASNTSAYG